MARTRESHEWTDEEVLHACREGNARAWRELVRRYTRLVLGIARAMGLQSDDADEVFQLTFSTLFRSLARLRQPDRIEAWLVTASRRATLRLLRDRRRHLRLAERHAAGTVDASAPPADERIETLRERERAARALRSLSEPCRTLLTALFSDDRVSYREQLWRIPGADVDVRIQPAGLGSPGVLHGQLFPLRRGVVALADGGVWLTQNRLRAAWSPLGDNGEFELPAPLAPRWALWLEWRGKRSRMEIH
jgi:RNA polymerase sigma factor (sigma-70 family)